MPTFIAKDLVSFCEQRLTGKLRSDTDIEAVVLAFLHYMTYPNDTFQSIEQQFGLAHSNFNDDFFTLIECGREWAQTKFPVGSLAERQTAGKDFVKPPSLRHTTLLCDSKIFLRQKVRGVGKGSKWWWGPQRCRGTKVVAFVSHDRVFRLLLGPFPPYMFDSTIIQEHRKVIQRKFNSRDVVMADNHFSKMKRWVNVTWEIRKRKPKGGQLNSKDRQFNRDHMAVGLSHMEGAWTKAVATLPRLRTKMKIGHHEHFALITIACAICNLKRNAKIKERGF